MHKQKLYSLNLGNYITFIALAAVTIIFGILTNGRLFKPMNVSNIFVQNGYLFFLSISLFFCILTGNTDLSVGSIVGLVGAVVGILYVNVKLPIYVAIACGVLVGLSIGALHGFLITKLNFAPFIITLAGNFVYRGITQFMLKGDTLGPLTPGLKKFATGYILSDLRIGNINVVCAAAPVVVAVLVFISEFNKRKNLLQYNMKAPSKMAVILKTIGVTAFISVIMYFLNQYKGIPIIILIAAIVLAIYVFIANNTVIGRRIYAVGGNKSAASLSGVNVKKELFLVFFNSAMIATFAALVVAGRVNATSTNAGDGYQMDAIAACYLGGCAGSGGSGSLFNVIVGALVICILMNGMTLIGLGSDVQQIVKGLVLLAAVAIDVVSRSRTNG